MNKLLSFLLKGKPGKTAEEERMRRNALIVLTSTGLATILGFILNAATVPESRIVLVGVSILMFICAYLAWMGIVLPGRILAPAVGVIAVAFLANRGLGVHDTSMLAFFLAIMLGAILLGEIGVIATTIASAIAGGTLAIMEMSGASSNFASQYTSTSDIIVITLSLLASGSILWVVIRQLNMGIRSARENEEKQSAANQELRFLQTQLEKRVEERTADLNRRTSQLEAAGFVARRTSEIVEIDKLLDEVVNVIAEQFNIYHVGIYLTDPSGRYLELQAASSEGGQQLLAQGQSMAIGRQGIVGSTALTRRPRVALDVTNDSYFMHLPELPLTRSEMALPLIVREQLIGVLDIESSEASAFTPADLNTFQAMADQVALAIENARLIERSRAALKRAEISAAQTALSTWQDVITDKSKIYESANIGSKSRSAIRLDASASVLKIPLRLRGAQIGEITLAREASQTWSERERDMIDVIASQLSVAVDSARALEVSRRSAAREKVLSEMSGRFTSALDVDTLLQTAVRELQALPHVSEASIFIEPEDKAA